MPHNEGFLFWEESNKKNKSKINNIQRLKLK